MESPEPEPGRCGIGSRSGPLPFAVRTLSFRGKDGESYRLIMQRLPLLSFILLAAIPFASWAAPLTVFFGTSGKETKGIYQATFHPETGKLSPAKLAAEIGSPGFLALHPDKTSLYAVGRWDKSSGVIGYRIGPNHELTEFTRQANPDGGGAHIAVHPSGKFLLTAQYGGGSTALFPLDEAGVLGEPTVTEHQGGSGVVPRRQEAPHPHWCGFSSDGAYALVPDLGLDQIVIYKVDLSASTPAIHPHSTADSVPGGGPRHMRFSPDEKFIYLLNELTLSVTTFAWDAATGTTEMLGVAPALSEETKAAETFNSSAEILVHPSGKFVYSSNRGHDSISVYQADPSTGALEVIQVQPVRGAFPRNINFDPSHTWVLAAGQDSDTIAAHRLDPETGKLTYERGAIIHVPSPICILFAP
ncbi:MAG: lactonase family protein [Verrucomicrobiota bacterium]